MEFETDYETILEKISRIDPVKYGRTRNFIDGAISRLSPYISRGVISTRQVLEITLSRGYKISQIYFFLRELMWRDYFQRVGQEKDLDVEIQHPQAGVFNHEIPSAVVDTTTGIDGIDTAIKQLYETGYMHNHCRMYTAMLTCNIAGSHWYHPAQWMYYYLLDGDWASNGCSWQWVAGANSHKKYYANQENINKYTYSDQVNTYLDKPYETLVKMEPPALLLNTQNIGLQTDLPENTIVQFNSTQPTFIYNYYNLDPLWHKDEPGNRILLIEPAFFSKYPVSRKCIDFMLELSKNIPGIQVYTGSFKSFADQYNAGTIYYKEHPLCLNYHGIKEERDWIAADVSGYYPSFFSYWKKVEKQLMMENNGGTEDSNSKK